MAGRHQAAGSFNFILFGFTVGTHVTNINSSAAAVTAGQGTSILYYHLTIQYNPLTLTCVAPSFGVYLLCFALAVGNAGHSAWSDRDDMTGWVTQHQTYCFAMPFHVCTFRAAAWGKVLCPT